MYLYHYYDRRTGPFRSLTAIGQEEAAEILRREFSAKGGIMDIETPYYMVPGHSPWLSTWYEQGEFLKIPVTEFDLRKISFTYGDSMPTFNPKVNIGKEYHMKLYFYEEILKIIEKYGFPQDWNDDGAHGAERYIEVQVWTEEPLKKYLR